MLFAGRQMELEVIMLGKISQIQKAQNVYFWDRQRQMRQTDTETRKTEAIRDEKGNQEREEKKRRKERESGNGG